jgi:hypothetical protein
MLQVPVGSVQKDNMLQQLQVCDQHGRHKPQERPPLTQRQRVYLLCIAAGRVCEEETVQGSKET